MTKRGRVIAIVGAALVGIALVVLVGPRVRELATRGTTRGTSSPASVATPAQSRGAAVVENAKGTIRGVVRASVGGTATRARADGAAPAGNAAPGASVRAGSGVSAGSGANAGSGGHAALDAAPIVVVDGAPIAGARVCAVDRDGASACGTSDARGAFSIAGLAAGAYVVSASAASFRPSARVERVWLSAGQEVALDLALVGGAVKIEGTVSDISGGVIAHARVQAAPVGFDINEPRDWLPAVESDGQGAFTLWVAPGDTRLRALADGYAEVEVDTDAPGTVAILMTPEASIEGVVVDERGAPVEGARVDATWVSFRRHARTDADGRFLVTGLVPARYDIEAHTDRGYGRSTGSVRVGLGARARAGTIQLGTVARVSGRVVVDGKPCANARAKLVDQARDREVLLVAGPDGVLRGDGVRAGSYGVYPRCEGAFSPAKQPRLVVGDRDLTDLVWTMSAGARVRGVVRTDAGAPVEGASVQVRWETGSVSGRSGPDGRYELAGIAPGEHELAATTAQAATAGARLAFAAGATIEKDLVLDVAAEIRGVVVDTQGRPVGGIDVRAVGARTQRGDNDPGDLDTTSPDGRFALFVRPGSFDVSADRGMAQHISRVERVIVDAGDSIEVRLVVPPQTGVIRGRVVDADGAPVPDAYVTAYIADGITAGWRWSFDDHPVLTAADGTFVIEGLGAGSYTVEATRRGGGETKAHGVELGANLTLVIAPTGSIRGTVAYADGTHPSEMHITVRDEDRFYRAELFHRTAGAFAIDDLVPGPLTLAVVTEDGFGVATVTLAAGEQRANVAIVLERKHLVRGRLLDARSKAPLAGVAVYATTQRAMLGSVIDHDDPSRWSGPDGRFAFLAFPGEIQIETYSSTRDGTCRPAVPLVLRGPLDLGDVLVVTTRPGERGDLGFTARDAAVDTVAPDGPAARAGLRVGDTLRAIDGVPVDGELRPCIRQLLVAPPGTEVILQTSRATVRVTAI